MSFVFSTIFVVFDGLFAVSVNTLRRHLSSELLLVNIHHTAFTPYVCYHTKFGRFRSTVWACRVGSLPGLNWFFPARWIKPGLNQIKPGLSRQNWVQYNNAHYISSTFLPSDPVCSKQYSALYLIFHSITYS